MEAQLIRRLDRVREYAEDMPVELCRLSTGRLVIRASNEGGHNFTAVDLEDLLDALMICLPQLGTLFSTVTAALKA